MIDVKRPETPRPVDCPTLVDVDVRLVLVVNTAGVAAIERIFVVKWLLSRFVLSVVSPWLLFDDIDSFKSDSIFVELNCKSNRSLASLNILRRPVGSSWNEKSIEKVLIFLISIENNYQKSYLVNEWCLIQQLNVVF